VVIVVVVVGVSAAGHRSPYSLLKDCNGRRGTGVSASGKKSGQSSLNTSCSESCFSSNDCHPALLAKGNFTGAFITLLAYCSLLMPGKCLFLLRSSLCDEWRF